MQRRTLPNLIAFRVGLCTKPKIKDPVSMNLALSARSQKLQSASPAEIAQVGKVKAATLSITVLAGTAGTGGSVGQGFTV